MTSGDFPHYTNCAGADGRYTLFRLGPYTWPIEFTGAGYGNEWSGAASDRFSAAGIQVRSGAMVTLDALLRPEARIVNFDRGPNAPELWAITAFDAVTGDIAGSAVYHAPDLGGLNAGPVILRYEGNTPGVEPCWYVGRPRPGLPTGRRSAPTQLRMSPGQTINGLSIIPGVTCLSSSQPLIPRRPATIAR
jgi:hypothetical protein